MYVKINVLYVHCTAYILHILDLALTLAHLYLSRCNIILRHTHIIKKGEIYQKLKSSVVWVGET